MKPWYKLMAELFSVEYILLYAIFLFLPWYSKGGGGFQFVDIPTVGFIICGLFNKSFLLFFKQKSKSIKFNAFILIIFVLYHTASLLVHSVLLETLKIGMPCFTFLYGLIITITVFGFIKNVYETQGSQVLCKVLINALFISFIIPFIYLYKLPYSFCKNALSFYNPSQILLFSLMQFAIIHYIIFFLHNNRSLLEKAKIFVLVQLNLLLLICATSRSILFVLIPYITSLYFLFNKEKNITLRKLAIYFIVLWSPGCILALNYIKTCTTNININQLIIDMGIRFKIEYLLNTTMNTAKLSILNTKLLFGSGLRLNPDELEFHNNFLEIFYQSGIIGLLLYALFFILVLYNLIKKNLLYAVPFVAFILVSSFHFSQRSRFSWIFIAFTFLTLAMNRDKLLKNPK